MSNPSAASTRPPLGTSLALLAAKARDNVVLDAALLRTPELPPGARLALAARKYAAIARDRRAIAYLGHTFHYDNRFTPALLPGYLDHVTVLDRVIVLDRARTVVDVGANVGQFAATLAWTHPGMRIWSFEPNPVARQILARNVAQTPGWTVVPYAIGDHDGDTDLFFVPGKSAQGSVHPENAAAGLLQPDVHKVRVPLRRLDAAFAAELGLPDVIDLLKVDVEGAEEQALRGLRALRWRHLLLETSLEREGLDLVGALDLLEELHGTRPEVAWAEERRPGDVARDAILRMPGL